MVTVDGNRLILLPDGPERLEAILDLIGDAKTSLRLLYYIFAGDWSGSARCATPWSERNSAASRSRC